MTGVDANNNRIGQCVFVYIGVVSTNPDAGQKGGVVFFDFGGDPTGNSVANNIFYQNSSDISYEGVTAPQDVRDNWLNADGSPDFVDWNSADLDPSDRNASNFHLLSDSGAIDGGGWLTTCASTTSGTSLVVADSYWFTDGGGIAPGDVIQLEGETTPLTVTGIDYATHTLTISPSFSWTSGQGVSFAYNGSIPDQGAYEFFAGADTVNFTTLNATTITVG